jgi:hypothetical protein
MLISTFLVKRWNRLAIRRRSPTTRPKTKETFMHVQPYLNFDGRCDEALDFYKQAIGAKVGMLMRFKEAPDKSMISPGSEDKVMHSAVQVGDSTVLMSDGRCTGKPNFNGIATPPRPRLKPTSFSTAWPRAAR